jgi:hypothetical protein
LKFSYPEEVVAYRSKVPTESKNTEIKPEAEE